MTIRNEASVRQDLIDSINGDGQLDIDPMWFAGCILAWMNEDMCREMVANMPDFEHMTEAYEWEGSEDDEDDEEE